jgi:hypothetical protein
LPHPLKGGYEGIVKIIKIFFTVQIDCTEEIEVCVIKQKTKEV